VVNRGISDDEQGRAEVLVLSLQPPDAHVSPEILAIVIEAVAEDLHAAAVQAVVDEGRDYA
jgi:hypothetical protein